MLKVSLDFDGTLSTLPVQRLAYELIQQGVAVYICTARFQAGEKKVGWDNSDLFEVADHIGLPRENIIFTGYMSKTQYLVENDITIHLDDDYMTVKDLNEKSQVIGIHYLNPDWSSKITEHLAGYDKHITVRRENEDNAGIKPIVSSS